MAMDPRPPSPGRTLAEILTQDSVRPLVLFLAVKLLGLGGLVGLTTGAQAALVVFGLPVWAWGAVFVGVALALNTGLLARQRRLQRLATCAALICWILICAATAVRNPIGTIVYYAPELLALGWVFWRARPGGV